MTRAALRATVVVVVSALAAGYAVVRAGAPGAEGLTAAQAEEMVRRHNDWRGTVRVRPLEWSADLARLAQSRADALAADGCRLRHRKLPHDVGENLFSATPDREDPTYQVSAIAPWWIVDAWANEIQDYDYKKNKCARGKQCGHYTQVVWWATRQVGCAMSVCASRGQIWVCDYHPAGNVEGRRPY